MFNDGLEQEAPEVVVLYGQSVEEVKELLKDDRLYANKKKDDLKYIKSFIKEEETKKAYKPCESFVEDMSPSIRPDKTRSDDKIDPIRPDYISESFMQKEVNQAKECIAKAAKAKLMFEDAPNVDESFVNLERLRKTEIKKDFTLFNTWRRLASVGETCIDEHNCLPDDLSPTQELMDYMIHKINKEFPDLKAVWEEGRWNPCLLINGCMTHISMSKLTFAYNGLKNVVDDLNAQKIICDIILKKLEVLFV
jgi:hypothetical protein